MPVLWLFVQFSKYYLSKSLWSLWPRFPGLRIRGSRLIKFEGELLPNQEYVIHYCWYICIYRQISWIHILQTMLFLNSKFEAKRSYVWSLHVQVNPAKATLPHSTSWCARHDTLLMTATLWGMTFGFFPVAICKVCSKFEPSAWYAVRLFAYLHSHDCNNYLFLYDCYWSGASATEGDGQTTQAVQMNKSSQFCLAGGLTFCYQSGTFSFLCYALGVRITPLVGCYSLKQREGAV